MLAVLLWLQHKGKEGKAGRSSRCSDKSYVEMAILNLQMCLRPDRIAFRYSSCSKNMEANKVRKDEIGKPLQATCQGDVTE